MTTALVLLGHGSHLSPQTAGLVWQQVDFLRATHAADEITAAFWKEQPAFGTVLASLAAEDVTFVPLFTAKGYFTRSVIPAEIGLTDTITMQGGRTLRYTAPLGEHPFAAHAIRQRIAAAFDQIGTTTHPIGVALIGHGTRRNPHSRTTTHAQVEQLRADPRLAAVTAVFLDDTPSIPEVYTLLDTPIIIAVPNFLAAGSHAMQDVPNALGLAEGQMSATLQGRTVIYTQPIGVNENLSRVILDLAHSVAAPLPTPTPGTPWDCLPQVGAARLIATVREHGQLAFGQITLTPTQVWAGSGAHNLTSLPELREHVRQQPHFRSLATCADLPLDWHIAITPAQLPAVVETVYPGVLAAWAGNAPVQPLERVIARQTGMFQALADFAQTADSITQICAHCILQPAWQTAADQPFPCTMPCNHGLSHALERIQEA